jgi:curved DNA-binding protein CbpA
MFRFNKSFQNLKRGFKQLFEARLPTKDELQKAYDIFGLKPGDDLSGLDKLWKELAKKNHPDLGGDPEKMKEINWAKDILNDFGYGFRGGSTRVNWDEIKKRNEENGKISISMLEKVLQTIKKSESKYDEYFKKFFPDLKPEDFKYSKRSLEDQGVYGADAVWTWANDDKSTVLAFRVNVSKHQQTSQGLGSGESDEPSFNVRVETDLFNKGRKYKIGQSSWQATQKLSSDLIKPDSVFPEKVLKRVSGQTRSKGKMQRRDFVASLSHQFNARSLGDDHYLLPIDEKTSLYIKRTVVMRMPSWDIHGIKEEGKKTSYDLSKTFLPENEETIELLKLIMDALKKGDQNKAKSILDKAKTTYESILGKVKSTYD